MFAQTIQQIKTAVLLLIIFTLLTGLLYPGIVTGLAQLLFPWQANGSLIEHNDKPIGSLLIGQYFTDPRYFWGRPSATPGYPYNATSSGGSNMGPSNPTFLAQVKDRITQLQHVDPENQQLIPVDLVTASGSGLDPDISPLAAVYQIPRIAKARGIPAAEVELLVQQHTKNRTLGILGEPRVNVLELNLVLDNIQIKPVD